METDTPEGEPTRRQWLGYWSMIAQQTQNAFNDKAAQFILVPLGGIVGYSVESWAGMMIALPFVMFAPLAGWMSDRFSKKNVILGSAIAQVVILTMITAAVWWKNMPLALFGFFMLAMQSAIFSPAKMGINKELVGSRHLGFASGVQQMTAMLAILVGQITAGIWYDERYKALGRTPEHAWEAALIPLIILTCLAVPAVGMSMLIPQGRAHASKPLTFDLLSSHFRDLASLWKDQGLRRASFGVAFFWGFAAFINLWSVKIAKAMTEGGGGFGTLSSVFMAAASLGMALGFGFASWLLRKKIELGWVPLAGFIMTLSVFALAWFPMGKAEAFLSLLADWDVMAFIKAHPHEALFLVTLGVVAFSAAIFLAPLNAWLQDRYPPEKRGELQAAVNLQDCFAGIIAVVVIEGMFFVTGLFEMSELAGFRTQLVAIGLACALMTGYVLKILPADFIRLVGVFIVKTLYRIRFTGLDRLPKTGGALLLPNHVTYADAFYLSAVSNRPLRFVMDETFMANPTIRLSAKLFGSVPIRRSQPREAIRAMIDALENGDVVVLFPEGQLTRTGALCELERGFELIARSSKAPIIPVWVDGLWGSIFSFERGRYFKKIPNQVPLSLSVAFGEPITSEKPTQAMLQSALMKASAEAIANRFGKKSSAVDVNAYQLGQLAALPRKATLHVLAGDETFAPVLPVLERFVKKFGGKLIRSPYFTPTAGSIWLGAEGLREKIKSADFSESEIRFFDFSQTAAAEWDKPGVLHLPCLAVDGLVVSMSIPHPAMPRPESFFQVGHKPGTLGKLLPGWSLEDGKLYPGGLSLAKGARLDGESFLLIDPASCNLPDAP